MGTSLRFHKRRLFGALILAASATAAHATDNLDSLARVQRPITVYGAIGQPAPAWIGFSLGVQLHPGLQLVGGTGFFWNGDIRIQSVSAIARFHVLPFEVSPILGAGVSYLKLSGNDSLQGLDESTVLGVLQVGVDWCSDFGLRLGAGWSFHFPLNLNFPFIELGFSF